MPKPKWIDYADTKVETVQDNEDGKHYCDDSEPKGFHQSLIRSGMRRRLRVE
ncbi:MAG: hypothetical protein QM706_02530 [Nitrospira sp.]